MKKSQCYIACRGENKELIFKLTDSFVHIVTDPQGNSFNIHFHQVGTTWSATEESTGVRCVPRYYNTRDECQAAVVLFCSEYKRLLSSEWSIDLKKKLKEFKEQLI